MNPEDVLIRVQLEVAGAVSQVKKIEDELLRMQGIADKMHTNQQAHGQQHVDLLEQQTSGWRKMGKEIGTFGRNVVVIGTANRLLEQSLSTMENLSAEMGFMRSSAGLTTQAFTEMRDGILEAGTITGESADRMAQLAAQLTGSSGLRDGMGDLIVASETMSKTFGVSSTSFGDMAADAIKMSNGLLKGSDIMEQFNKATGLTGANMEKLMQHLQVMTKSLGKVVGGGQKFATAFKQIAKFSAGASAEILKLGGDPESFQALQEAILDPNRWQEVTSILPGMAGGLYDMQAALSAGDMDTFSKLFQQGAQDTLTMTSGLNSAAMAASGFDKRMAEVFATMDMKKAVAGGEATATVMERAMTMVKGFGTEIARFFNTLVMPIVQKLMPIFEGMVSLFVKFNDLLANNTAVRYFTTGVVAALGIAAMWFGILSIKAKFFGKALAETAKTTGKALGEGVGAGLESVSKGFVALGKGAVGILAVGGGFALLGAGFLLMALGVKQLEGVQWSTIGKGLVLMGAGMAIFLLSAATLLIPGVGQALGIAMLVLGGSMLMFGAGVLAMATAFAIAAPAMAQMAVSLPGFATGLTALADSSWIQASLALGSIGGALAVFGVGGAMGALAIPFIVSSLMNLSEAIDKVKTINPNDVKKVMIGLRDAFNGVNIKSDVTVNEGFIGSVKAIIDGVLMLHANMTQLLVVGEVMKTNAGALQKLFDDLFAGKDALLVKPILTVNNSLQHWYGNTTIQNNVAESFKTIFSIVGGFAENFVKLATMSVMMGKEFNGETFKAILSRGIDDLSGPDGFLTKMVTSIGAINMGDFAKNITALAELKEKGQVASAVNAVSDLQAGIAAFDSVRLTQTREVSIAATSGAEVALNDYNAARVQHEVTVEDLLTDIRDTLKTSNRQAPVRVKTAGDAPAWNPENVFAQFDGETW